MTKKLGWRAEIFEARNKTGVLMSNEQASREQGEKKLERWDVNTC
jgi:hypothetical protein